MRNCFRCFILFFLLGNAAALRAQDVPHYICYQTNGFPDENVWRKADWTADFTDIEGASKPAPFHRTRVKMLWDTLHLYILAELTEPHIWGTLRQHDTIIYRDNDFEVFIDPDGDTHQYFEIEVNALNTVMDLLMSKPYRNGGQAMLTWDVKQLRTAVRINGTLNNAGDTDSSWTVEMAIPFESLAFFNTRVAPEDGTTWRINFSRVQWETDVRDGRYVKRPHTPEYNWVWSPQGAINMHAPEKWGYLQFSDRSAGGEKVRFSEPVTAAAQKQLWEIYYRQQQHRRQYLQYAKDVSELGLSSTATIEATSSQFTATIKDAVFITIINHEGKIVSYHE